MILAQLSVTASPLESRSPIIARSSRWARLTDRLRMAADPELVDRSLQRVSPTSASTRLEPTTAQVQTATAHPARGLLSSRSSAGQDVVRDQVERANAEHPGRHRIDGACPRYPTPRGPGLTLEQARTERARTLALHALLEDLVPRDVLAGTGILPAHRTVPRRDVAPEGPLAMRLLRPPRLASQQAEVEPRDRLEAFLLEGGRVDRRRQSEPRHCRARQAVSERVHARQRDRQLAANRISPASARTAAVSIASVNSYVSSCAGSFGSAMAVYGLPKTTVTNGFCWSAATDSSSDTPAPTGPSGR